MKFLPNHVQFSSVYIHEVKAVLNNYLHDEETMKIR